MRIIGIILLGTLAVILPIVVIYVTDEPAAGIGVAIPLGYFLGRLSI